MYIAYVNCSYKIVVYSKHIEPIQSVRTNMSNLSTEWKSNLVIIYKTYRIHLSGFFGINHFQKPHGLYNTYFCTTRSIIIQ